MCSSHPDCLLWLVNNEWIISKLSPSFDNANKYCLGEIFQFHMTYTQTQCIHGHIDEPNKGRKNMYYNHFFCIVVHHDKGLCLGFSSLLGLIHWLKRITYHSACFFALSGYPLSNPIIPLPFIMTPVLCAISKKGMREGKRKQNISWRGSVLGNLTCIPLFSVCSFHKTEAISLPESRALWSHRATKSNW